MELLPKDVQQIVRNYIVQYEHRIKYTQVIKEYHALEWTFYDDIGFATKGGRVLLYQLNYRGLQFPKYYTYIRTFQTKHRDKRTNTVCGKLPPNYFYTQTIFTP